MAPQPPTPALLQRRNPPASQRPHSDCPVNGTAGDAEQCSLSTAHGRSSGLCNSRRAGWSYLGLRCHSSTARIHNNGHVSEWLRLREGGRGNKHRSRATIRRTVSSFRHFWAKRTRVSIFGPIFVVRTCHVLRSVAAEASGDVRAGLCRTGDAEEPTILCRKPVS